MPDVDDLEEIGDVERYIARASTVVVYCSDGYFKSKNCMRELISATALEKLTIALVDPDASRGGLSSKEIREQLVEAEASYAKWDLIVSTTPSGEALFEHLFAYEPVEWNRIGHFRAAMGY